MDNPSKIVGLTPVKIIESDDCEIRMTFSNGSVGRFYHEQDCCECVVIEDVSGDWSDLIGSPILLAEERTSVEPMHEKRPGEIWDESNTWTFYTFRGIGGTVDVRWHGSSNGEYAESVDFSLSPPPE